MHSEKQKKTRFYSLMICLVCVLSVFLGGRMQKAREGFPLGDLSAYSAEEALEAYESGGEPEDLIRYLKILCWQASEGSEEAAEAAARWGTELLSMAKAGTIDLEALGNQDPQLLDLLQLIRSHGAK